MLARSVQWYTGESTNELQGRRMRMRGPAGQPIADYIAEVAGDLFYRFGLHAVGVDRIAEMAGVTKRTLYRHYQTKDELIAASLRHAPRVAFPTDGPPLERIVGAFKLLEPYLTGSRYRGCPYIIFTAELTVETHPAHVLIEKLVAKRRAWFRDRVDEAGLISADVVAEQLDLLFDGALASGAKRRDVVASRTALDLARLVLANAVTNTGLLEVRPLVAHRAHNRDK